MPDTNDKYLESFILLVIHSEPCRGEMSYTCDISLLRVNIAFSSRPTEESTKMYGCIAEKTKLSNIILYYYNKNLSNIGLYHIQGHKTRVLYAVYRTKSI